MTHRPLQGLQPFHIEHCVILTGKRCLAAVLAERGGANRHLAAAQCDVVLFQLRNGFIETGVADHKRRRHRQPHCQQARQAVGLATQTGILNLLQLQNRGTHSA